MSGPPRLHEESESDLERALLDAGRSYKGSAETRRKTLVALGLAGSATLAAGTASAGVWSTLHKIVSAKVLVGVSALAAVTAVPIGYYAWQRDREPRPAGAAVRVERTAPLETPAPVPDVAGVGAAAPAAAANAVSPPARPDAPEVRARSAPARLRQELAALDAARNRLGAGDPETALTILRAYERAHPRGRLELEAEILRIDALAQSGRPQTARQRARLFLQRYPGSALAQRAGRHLDD